MPKTRDERFRAFADTIPTPLRLLTPAGRAVWFNATWLSFVGRTAREVAGDGWADVVHPDEFGPCLDAAATGAATARRFALDYRLRRADGEYRWVMETANPLSGPNGMVTGYVCSLTDVTDAKRAEIRSATVEDDKARFLAAVAYELQARLVPAADGLELLSGPLPRSRRPRVRAAVHEQLEHACGFVGDLLDVSRIALGQVRLHPDRVSLRTPLESAAAAVRPTIHSAGHRVVMRLPEAALSVVADEERLFQAFALLIRFASEGTPEGGRIAVFYTRTPETVQIHIKDGGRGVPEERLAGLLDLFAQREDSRRGVPPVLGLSLFTARRLIELHGGTVQATNVEPARGLLITVRLPLAPDISHGVILGGAAGGPQRGVSERGSS
jgi:two-component system, chemotaxis family, CheB/CheR fusion protein